MRAAIDGVPSAVMRRRVAALAAVSVCALLAGCGGKAQADKPKTFTIHGTVTISDFNGIGHDNGSCFGTDGYHDLTEGAQVTVSDAAGKTIAIGSLGPGGSISGINLYGDCEFSFSVPKVPEGKKFYGVEVTHRGVIRYTSKEAHSTIKQTLGS